MNSRQRFNETMRYGKPDRVPYFAEGIRTETLEAWYEQGLPRNADFSQMFPSDKREELHPDIEPKPGFSKWPTKPAELDVLRQRLNPSDDSRLPSDWPARVERWKNRDHVLMLRVYRGLFETLGINDWNRFAEVIFLLTDEEKFVIEYLTIYGEFAAQLAERVLSEVTIDAAIFSEPIGGNHGSLISPQMYERYALSSYQPILDVLKKHAVETIIMRTYANARVLIPSILRWGFNCLWAVEVNVESMNYLDIRKEYGRDLRLIGGLDLDVLRYDQETIKREVETKVPILLAQGGYVPQVDGRVRPDVSFRNYVYYRELLEKVTHR